jgi:alpha-tubulin suppressor-like RCC1 family protein
MRRAVLVAVMLGGVAVAGCYRPELGPCAVRCDESTACPASLSCESDGFCHAPGEALCLPDAQTPDAEPPDAEPDGGMETTDYVAISAGNTHTCAIRSTGAAVCWGANGSGQLGVPAAGRRSPTPVDLAGPGVWSKISAGQYHTCGIRDGVLFCWGRNALGQAGDPTNTDVTLPRAVDGGANTDWTAVCAGNEHSCAIRAGDVWCWGSDGAGALGDGTPGEARATPMAISNAAEIHDWVDVTCGGGHTCARRPTGDVYCWGEGSHGELGTGTSDVAVPTQLTGFVFSQIDAGCATTCGMVGNVAHCWGDNSSGQLARDPNTTTTSSAPLSIATGVLGVSAGCTGGCAYAENGVSCWGGGFAGELGDGTWNFSAELHSVSGISSGVAEVSAGSQYSCARREGGSVLCWGRNDEGQIGDGTVAVEDEPVRVGTATDWVHVATGTEHTCGIRGATGDVYCWGSNDRLQLGVDGPDSATPQLVPVSGMTDLALGLRHTCAVGGPDVYCWGGDDIGQIGDGVGTVGDKLPVEVLPANTQTILDVGVGPRSSAVVLATNDRVVWGEQGGGQLGNGQSAGARETPQTLTDAEPWTELSLGGHFGCAIEAAHLSCWGVDDRGQQGRGGNSASTTNMSTDATRNWTVIAGSHDGIHVCGVADDNLYCWGGNDVGQVGNNTSGVDALTPQLVSNAVWTDVTAGVYHSCGISGGALWCWGSNFDLQLGTPQVQTTIDEPVQIGDSTSWVQVSGGRTTTCAIDVDGALYCWGRAVRGQLGTGGAYRSRPASVVR